MTTTDLIVLAVTSLGAATVNGPPRIRVSS
jgi:hypothetical protein